MPNPISDQVKIGTIGELLVQIRFLQYGVQAAPPIKDSGTDLVAIRDGIYKSVQIKTTSIRRFRTPTLAKHCDLLVLVELEGFGREIRLDYSRVFLIPRSEVGDYLPSRLEPFLISENLVDRIFAVAAKTKTKTKRLRI